MQPVPAPETATSAAHAKPIIRTRGKSIPHLIGRALVILALLALASLLAACGHVTTGSDQALTSSSTGAASPTAVASPARVASPTASKFASGAGNGCPAPQAPADAGSFTPDVVVSQNSASAGSAQSITLTRGQRLEIRLQSAYNWQLSVSDPGHILASTTPEGWYDESLKACIWRFTATGSGNARLSFSGAIVCPPLELCPSDDQALSYQVTVH